MNLSEVLVFSFHEDERVRKLAYEFTLAQKEIEELKKEQERLRVRRQKSTSAYTVSNALVDQTLNALSAVRHAVTQLEFSRIDARHLRMLYDNLQEALEDEQR